MDGLRDIYERFKQNHRTESGGINLYPEFDADLNCLLAFLDDELEVRNPYVDCSWQPPYGEDD